MSNFFENRLIALVIEELEMIPATEPIPSSLAKKVRYWMGQLEARQRDLVFKSLALQRTSEALRRHQMDSDGDRL